MEVKLGYKQTEVGVIPEDWEIRTIRNVSSMVTVGFVGSMAHLFTANGVPLLRGQNVLPGRIDLTDSRFISPQTHDLWKKSALRGGDIVIVRVGYPGTCAVVPTDFGAANAASLVVVRPDPSCIESDFMCCVLLSDIGRRQVKAAMVGGAQQVINIGTAASLVLPIPNKPEQRAIATALSDVDGLLGGLDRLIAKKHDLKQAAMQQLLTGQTRLPGFRGEWEVKRLKTIVQTPVTDGPHLTPQFYEDGIPFLSVNNLVGNRIDLTDLRFISQQDHELFSRKCKPRKDDILLGKAASVGKVAIVELDYEFNIWSPIALIRISSDHVPRFIYYQLQSVDLMGQVILLTNSSSQGNIGMGDIEKLILKLPSHAEQTAIAEVLTEMDGELAVLEQRREKTRALKQAMMQELLTGRIRLIGKN